jgi:hypothetical protein
VKYLLGTVVVFILSWLYINIGSKQNDSLEEPYINSYNNFINTTKSNNVKAEEDITHKLVTNNKKIIQQNKENIHNSKYSDKLDTLLSVKDNGNRKEFIKKILETLNPDTLHDVLNEYRINTDERSERRIVSSAILSEIKDDNLLNSFYEELGNDESLIADFVSATYYTNSQNSFDKLMALQELHFSQDATKYLKDGTLIMYQGSVTKDVTSHIGAWLSNRSYINRQQENIIIGLLSQSSYSNAKVAVENNISKFSSEGYKALQELVNNSPQRE